MRDNYKKPASKKSAAINASDDLLRETLGVLNREKVFPKRSRWLIAYPIAEIVNNYHTMVAYANGIKVTNHELFVERYTAQTLAIAWIYTLAVKMSAAQLILEANADRLDRWQELCNNADRVTKAWRNADVKRYEEQFGSLTADELREPSIYPVGAAGFSRSPNPSNSNNVRNVKADGSLNNNNANNANGAVADRE